MKRAEFTDKPTGSARIEIQMAPAVHGNCRGRFVFGGRLHVFVLRDGLGGLLESRDQAFRDRVHQIGVDLV